MVRRSCKPVRSLTRLKIKAGKETLLCPRNLSVRPFLCRERCWESQVEPSPGGTMVVADGSGTPEAPGRPPESPGQPHVGCFQRKEIGLSYGQLKFVPKERLQQLKCMASSQGRVTVAKTWGKACRRCGQSEGGKKLLRPLVEGGVGDSAKNLYPVSQWKKNLNASGG